MTAVLDRTSTFYVGINPPTGDYDLLDNQPAIGGVVLTKDTTKADLDLDKVFQYRGQVASYNKLPKKASIGDTYNVLDTGENYAWNGSSWDLLTGTEAVYWKNNALESQGSILTIDATKNKITNLVDNDTIKVNEDNQLYVDIQVVDDNSTTSTTLGWSASKLNGIIGDIETAINTIRGV